MQHRFAFECLDRSLRDITRSSDESRSNLPFGGITMVLGGDFRQILPVIPHADRAVILEACITRSRLWNICQIFILKKNMRLNKGTSPSEIEELNKFAKWVLAVGDGKVENHQTGENLVEDEIEVPLQFCDLENDNSVENMITNISPDFVKNAKDPEYLSQRAILTPTNQTVGHLNSLIVEMIPGESTTYYSVDSAEDFGGTDEDLHSAFPIEYLNSLNIPGLPAHDLKLKPGVVVMLMRNLNQTLGLCNGTRMIVTKFGLFLPKPVFTHGQFYVAISRVTSPAGLKGVNDAQQHPIIVIIASYKSNFIEGSSNKISNSFCNDFRNLHKT
ncbi:hypothetical protein DCAR_0934116 [Daucus carota subsp. sativus]|uniref:ATP-dependent DNA helicase n=1 Tax=Daucus carota subsp. sativus TaxID=79200 RepID=A0AAF0XY19_DAUCS|nr:hypothetical protein DCAR_0934116 [Daucus carota subsp. sativus]